MSSEQDQKPSGSNSDQSVSELKPIRYAGARTLGLGILPPVQYGLFSEKIRQNGSKQFQCSLFCDGKKCKYEDPSFWAPEEMAIKGIYSCWVTEDIVTMARPSTAIIEKHKIIKQFKELGIRSLINLQQRGEHGSCGVPLQNSGFSYDPQLFMDNNIFYYNFDWKDYGNVPKTRLLDMVKVLSFAVSEGRVAVHSHSGLGRPGVLLACHFIYTLRCKPNDAILFLRSKRTELVKTKGQVQSVQGFAQFVVPMFIVYANVITSTRDFSSSLNQFLRKQRFLLHGFEARLLKNIPKPIFMFCEKLLSLADEQRHFNNVTDDDSKGIDLIAGDPNRFLKYFSARMYQLDLRFPPSKFSEKHWSLLLPEEQHIQNIGKEQLMNGCLESDQRFCAPPSPPSGVVAKFNEEPSAFPESPNSSSSPDDSNQRSSSERMLGGLYRPLEEEDFLDYQLSDDEENGLNPELEFNNNINHPNSVPLRHSARKKSSELTRVTIANGPATILQNGGIGLSSKKLIESKKQELKDEITILDVDENSNEDKKQVDDLVVEEIDDEKDLEEEMEDEDDPLEDMNSEECNAIIDSVLQESASEEEVMNIGCRRSKKKKKPGFPKMKESVDLDAIKEGKGCSTTSAVEEEKNPEITKTLGQYVADALLMNHYAMDDDFAKKLRKYQRAINHRSSAWDKVAKETDPVILSALLWSWLDQLKEPVLNIRDLSCIVIRSDKPLDILHRLDFGTRYTTEYLVRFVVQLKPQSLTLRDDLLRRLVASLTHQSLGIGGTLRPVGKDWNKMRQGTVREVMLFVTTLYDMVVSSNKEQLLR